MNRTRIKFCGITRQEDAVAAANVGADAIGLNFCPSSSRQISIDQAKKILAVLPPFVTPVGLFVDASAEQIRETAGRLHLRHVQLHGKESPEVVAALNEFVVVKVIHVQRDSLSKTLSNWRNAISKLPLSHLRALLLETAGKVAGGSGIENDWSAIEIAQSAGEFDSLPSMIAAGGLTPENVAGVIRKIRPWAVDVSSGIESSPGVKSVEKMRTFAEAVHAAG